MLGLAWMAKAIDGQLPGGCALTRSLHLRALVIFLTHRIWRGGSRVLLQATALLLAVVVVVVGMLPTLGWSKAKVQGVPGLRIVVFGSQDLVGSSADAHDARTTWTEQLCRELHCSSFLSFVPKGGSGPGLTSNDLYGKELDALERQTKTSDLTKSPASNYAFVLEQYPVAVQTPDLEAQMRRFLSLPPPAVAPRQTLWVFTFGTWDVWNLAALPRESGKAAVDALVSHLFSQVEVLYGKALNPASIAFSDFWSNATAADIDRLADPEALDMMDERELESFRVVMPQLLDLTLTPGWRRRPEPPAPHSKAEQMRNADFLTRRWNWQMEAELSRWKARGRAKPEGIDEQGIDEQGIDEQRIDEAMRVPRAGSIVKHLPAVLRPQRGVLGGGSARAEGAVYAPYPRRAGLQSTQAATILEAITEEEVQRSGLGGGSGWGVLPANSTMRFADVWTPCVASAGNVAGVELGGGPSQGPCSSPDDHLFHDAFTVGQRAIEGLTHLAAEKIARDLFIY